MSSTIKSTVNHIRSSSVPSLKEHALQLAEKLTYLMQLSGITDEAQKEQSELNLLQELTLIDNELVEVGSILSYLNNELGKVLGLEEAETESPDESETERYDATGG